MKLRRDNFLGFTCFLFSITIKPLKNHLTHQAPPAAQARTLVLRSLAFSGKTPFPYLSHPFFNSSLSGFWYHLSEYFLLWSVISVLWVLWLPSYTLGYFFTPTDRASCVFSIILHCLVQFFCALLKVPSCGLSTFFLLSGTFCYSGIFHVQNRQDSSHWPHVALCFWNVAVWLNWTD